MLLDEPFGALDAKIREELRSTIREVQRELGITIILVTHDQEEAFALADRIGVMNLGRLLEVGKPDELYARPATRFVATFLGAANLLLARQTGEGIHVGTTPIGGRTDGGEVGREHEVVAVLRPEKSSGTVARSTQLYLLRIGHRANQVVYWRIGTLTHRHEQLRREQRIGHARCDAHAARTTSVQTAPVRTWQLAWRRIHVLQHRCPASPYLPTMTAARKPCVNIIAR